MREQALDNQHVKHWGQQAAITNPLLDGKEDTAITIWAGETRTSSGDRDTSSPDTTAAGTGAPCGTPPTAALDDSVGGAATPTFFAFTLLSRDTVGDLAATEAYVATSRGLTFIQQVALEATAATQTTHSQIMTHYPEPGHGKKVRKRRLHV
ncbi:uncharacterized protein LOC143232655 isoform X1 [Tachypleus tridentatus]|uniref:uncharacterized protein LOC143232655 isoform X1 n=1 Tax=Tachypleus tridentatus TaxID=6853 RepID=UPI003FCFFFC8